MTNKNQPIESEVQFNDFPEREDNGTSLLFLSSPQEREVIPNVMYGSVMNFVSRDGERKSYKTIHAFLGSPAYAETENLSDEELTAELERLEKIMHEAGILIRTFTRIPERKIHEFITQELFPNLTTGNIVLSTELIYEEFHPNNHYLIKLSASEFLRTIFGMEAWSFDWKKSEQYFENGNAIKKFVRIYNSFDVVKMEFDELAIFDEHSASIIFEAEFYGITEDEIFVHHFEGDGRLWLEKSDDKWQVTRAELPERVV